MADSALSDIGVGEENYTPEEIGERQTEAEDRAVRIASRWFEDDQSARESTFAEWEEMDRLWRGDHWDLTAANGTVLRTADQQLKKPNPTENMTFSLIEGLIAEFSAQEIEIIDHPRTAADEQAALQMTRLKNYLWYKNRFTMEKVKFLRNLFKLGTGIWHPYWDPDWRGGKGPNRWLGEVRLQALHPQLVYPDARAKSDIHDGTRIHKGSSVTLEWVREHFPERGQYVREEVLDATELVGIEGVDEDDDHWARDGQAFVVQTWYIGRPLILAKDEREHGRGLHVLTWANLHQKLYLSHSNYVDPDQEPELPFIFRQCYPRENSVWGYSEGHFLKNPQIIYNKIIELITETSMHGSFGQTYYEPGALEPTQKQFIQENSGLAGMHFPVNDISKILRVYGKGPDQSLLTEANRIQRSMETIVGRHDISQGRTPGSVTAFRALDLLQQRAQVRLRLKEVAIRTAEEDLANYVNRLILANYNEMRTYRVLGRSERDKAQFENFDLASLKQVYEPATNTVVPWQGWSPPPGAQEGEDYEIYTPEFDSQAKVSTSLPSDRLFYMEMAKDLYANQRIDAKTFWFVVENGRFPAWEQIQQEMEAQQAQQAQQAQAQGQGQTVPFQEILAFLSAEEQEAFANASPEEQQAIIDQITQQTGVPVA